MPRGAPDYSNVRAYGPLHRLDDLAELAGRLGSPVTYDRRGSVLFLATFANGSGQFGLTSVGSGASLGVTPETFLSGPFSLRMLTSNVTDEISTVHTRIAIPEKTSKLGLEAGVSFTDVEVGFDIQISHYTGAKLYQYTLIYRSDQDRLYIVSPTGSGILDDNLVLYPGSHAWHKMKIVVDFENNTYLRALMDEDAYDVSDFDAYVYTNTEPKRIDVRLHGATRDNTTREIHWDNVIITQNEP